MGKFNSLRWVFFQQRCVERDSGVGEDEAEGGLLGPVAVAGRFGSGAGVGEEGAVATVSGFDEGNVGVGEDSGAGGGGDADERVVERVEDEGGDGDAVDDASGGGAVVVVVGRGEAGVEGGDALVEVAQGVDADGLIGIVGAGKKTGFAAKALEQGAKELEFVDAIEGAVEGVGGGAEVDGGRDADDGVELERGGGAEVAGEFEDEVSTHGVADEGNGLEAVEGAEVAHDGEDVVGEAGVVEGGGEVLGAAAVAHVHADDAAAGAPEFVGVADDVLGVG